MNILILAAGYGTRLYPLTLNTPKALLLINQKSLLTYLVEKIDRVKKVESWKEIVVVTNNKFYQQFILWRDGLERKDITILNDGSNSPQDRRGVIGDIKFAIGEAKGHWLILGADNFFDWELDNFIKFALEKIPYPTVGIYDVREKHLATQLGVVRISKDGIIEELIEKPKEPQSSLIATCIYFFPQQSLKFLDHYLSIYKFGDMAGQYIAWLVKKLPVYSFLFEGTWLDIGTKKTLMEAERLVKEKK
ncbi:MAG: hypothetical protein DRP68_01175 [Candidatus Omnitrophota bacterium]|nr:MAG: hypothetical protein DRP68_01175 [Candidatus Omnitrophota bacterium]RKY39102.1 MAG: hypothetical protein DRP72_00505 [Candidatus Omnitrophota bacterium]RKY46211.1 MAG: hypothetical protein DRP81_01240 [Candidatus Omnitrophota bacterium]HDN86344.1 nucleotidyltransferase family protein [Candidatus Omnitrophota bacterium]